MKRTAAPLRIVLLGDGESPHMLKWARALAPRCELWMASTRGFGPGLDDVLPASRRLALNTRPAFEGGNVSVLRSLPRLGAWLRHVDADWIHAHYLTSHGTLAWLARRIWRLRARLVGTAWGSDVLLAPQRHAALRWLTARVLRDCALCTSDSAHMAERMQELGAGEVMVLPFGLDSLPEAVREKDPWLFFANRTLEPLYAPQRVLEMFGVVAERYPLARLVVANDGSLRLELERHAAAAPFGQRVRFVGRLPPEPQASWYDRAQWYVSLPRSDAVSVSVLEAMAHGCVPLLSDLPANRELVRDGDNGLIIRDGDSDWPARMDALVARLQDIASSNRAWIARHAYFPEAVDRLLRRLAELGPGR